MVVDVPDVGLTPRLLRLRSTAANAASALSATFNSALDDALRGLPRPVHHVSLFNLIRDFTNNPNKYGFTNVTEPSFPDLAKSDTFLFWDDVHPTTRGHRHVADEIFQTLANGLLSRQPK